MDPVWVAIGANIGVWVVGVAVLAGQSRSNTTSIKEKQDLMNEHLLLLNNKTFTSHREIGKIIGTVSSLPCMAKTQPMHCPEDE